MEANENFRIDDEDLDATVSTKFCITLLSQINICFEEL